MALRVHLPVGRLSGMSCVSQSIPALQLGAYKNSSQLRGSVPDRGRCEQFSDSHRLTCGAARDHLSDFFGVEAASTSLHTLIVPGRAAFDSSCYTISNQRRGFEERAYYPQAFQEYIGVRFDRRGSWVKGIEMSLISDTE